MENYSLALMKTITLCYFRHLTFQYTFNLPIYFDILTTSSYAMSQTRTSFALNNEQDMIAFVKKNSPSFLVISLSCFVDKLEAKCFG